MNLNSRDKSRSNKVFRQAQCYMLPGVLLTPAHLAEFALLIADERELQVIRQLYSIATGRRCYES